MRSIGLMVCAMLGLGCGPSPKGVDSDEEGGDDGSSCLLDGAEDAERCSPIWFDDRKLVDILFVIDNSGSMATEQARLAAGIDALLQPLEEAGVDYRVGVTTTDNSNPWCGATTTPEAGAFVMSSCRGRLEHFWFTGTNGDLPDDWACTDHCALEPEQLDALMKPTPTDVDPEAKVRPWIQSGPLDTNLPDGVTGVDALRCVLPQGIDGCGFESQLESMYKAVQRTKNADEASYGFMRERAALAIVIVTDEADCSHAAKWEQIFTEDGGKVFWSDPDAQYPTSAVCWNAGVECTGGPGEYDECHAIDKDVAGTPTHDPSLAVLQPLDRYVSLIQGIQADKLAQNPYNDVMLAVIGGVPEGYVPGAVSGLYADADDPLFDDDFGIGPGCMSADYEFGLPPVRMRELVEGFGEHHLSSICADDYAPALTKLADDIEAHMPDLCYRECVRDVDFDEAGVQVDCVLEQESPGEPKIQVPPCALEQGAFVLPSADADVCWGAITDPAAMSESCGQAAWNLEFEIVRRAGVPVSSGAVLLPTCQLSETPAIDCPGLGG